MGGGINSAKERLAYEVTAVIHRKEQADKALAGARAAFGGAGDKDSMPTVEVSAASLGETKGVSAVDLFFDAKLGATKSDCRRLIEQGGAFWTSASGDETQITDVKFNFTQKEFAGGEIILRAGKKKIARAILR